MTLLQLLQRAESTGGNMRHARRWLIFWAKCSVATWLVHVATGLDWLQSLASVTLVLWGAIEAFRVLERLLGAFAGTDGEGDDGGGPEEELPVVIRTEGRPIAPPKPGYREWWRN